MENESSTDDDMVKDEESASALLNEVMNGMIDDYYMNEQFKKIRCLVCNFLDISKCYNNIFESSLPLPPVLQDDANDGYSKSMKQISKEVNIDPKDLVALNIFPSSFPHNISAFSEALCRVTEAQQRLVYSKASIENQNEFNKIQTQIPSPQILKQNKSFNEHVELQNELIKNVAYLSKENREQYKLIINLESDVYEKNLKLIEILKSDLQEKRNNILQHLKNIAQIEFYILTNQQIKLMMKYYTPCKLQQTDYSKQLTEIIIQMQNAKTIEQDQNILNQMKQIKENILKENVDYEKKLDEIKQQIQNENQFYQNQIIISRNPFKQFEDMTMKFKNFTDTNISCLKTLKNCEELILSCSNSTEQINFKEILLTTTAYETTLRYLDELSLCTQEKVTEKEQKNSEILEQIYDNREDTDILSSIVNVLKENRTSPEYLCKDCEKKRTYVITKCGHSFCKRCINNIYDENIWTCPYCQIEITENDIVKINWE